MHISQIIELVNGKLITEISSSQDFTTGLTSDLMSDILTLDTENAILITGLSNMQTIRTAEMSDIQCILIARNKDISQEMINLANQNEISIIKSPFSVFKVSGLMFSEGIKPIY